jgi:putative sporulation protein YtaF
VSKKSQCFNALFVNGFCRQAKRFPNSVSKKSQCAFRHGGLYHKIWDCYIKCIKFAAGELRVRVASSTGGKLPPVELVHCTRPQAKGFSKMPPIIEAAVLASSLSADAFTAGFAYGSKKIRIPMVSLQVINFVCCAIMGAAMFFGYLVKPLLSQGVAGWLAFGVLFVMGVVKLADGIVKALIRRHMGLDRAFRFSVFDIQFILHLYANPEAADADVSAHLSASEAVALAVSLSLDGMAVGFAAVLAGVNPWALLGWSLVTNMAAILAGRKIGHSLADKLPFNISWVGGIVLIVLAFSRL